MSPRPASSPVPTDPAALPFRVAETVRFNDLDSLGHANNNAFGVYFESGRVALHRAVDTAVRAPGTQIVLARIAIDYLAELLYGQTVTVGIGFARLGTTSWTTWSALFADGRCAAVSEAVTVLIDDASRRPVPLPDALRAACAPYLLT